MADKFEPLQMMILDFVEDDLPLVSRPFEELAGKIGVPEEKIVEEVKRLMDSGVIRRFGAIVKHTRVGFKENAMVVWKMKEDQIVEIEKIVKEDRRISHVYIRKTYPGKWDYNLYTMLHARNETELAELIEKISDITGCDDFRVLRTLKEFKKSSPRYVR